LATVTAIPIERRWTFRDLPSLPDDDRIYDILGGELVVRNVPNMNHAVVLSELMIFLGRAQEAGYGEVYTTSTAAALDYGTRGEDAEDVPHPDILFIRQARISLRGWQAVEGVPDLIIEILSPSTQSEHAPDGRWWDAYARNGVPYYWLVDPGRRLIRKYTLVGIPYQGGVFGEPSTLRAGDVLTSPLFPTLSLPVASVFRRVRDRPPRRRH
jgi:Uma2 family endonuclease